MDTFTSSRLIKNSCLLLFLLFFTQAFSQAPTTPSSNLNFNNLDGDRIRLNFTRGNGEKRIIIAKQGSPINALPTNGTDYVHDTNFGNGNAILPGEFVVYDGSSSSVTITGLQPFTTYHFKIYEYNGSGTNISYLTSSYLEGSQATVSAPTTQVSNLNFTDIYGSSMKLNWTRGDGDNVIIIAKEGSPVDVTPQDLTYYYYGYSTWNNNSHQIGSTGNYVIYKGSGNNRNISGLNSNTTYYFAAFEFNGNSGPVYLTPGITAQQTTPSTPSAQPTNLAFNSLQGNSVSISWSRSDAQKYLVVASENPITGSPVDGTAYTADTDFGSTTSSNLNSGEKIIYNGNRTYTSLSGLSPASTYYIKIFAYNESGTNTYYLRTSPLAGTITTIGAPTTQVSNLNFTDVTGTSMRLNYTRGDGDYVIIIAKEGSPVDVTPQDLTNYNGGYSPWNYNYNQIGSTGNYVVYKGTRAYANLNGFSPGSTYYFAAYEFNGNSGPVYLTPGITAQQTTSSTPSAQPTNLAFNSLQGNSVSISWSRSDAQNYLVVASENPITGSPVDGTAYTADTDYGSTSSSSLNSGEKIIYNGNSTSTFLSGLSPASTYYIKIFAFNGSDTSTSYLTSSPLANSFNTLAAPSTQVSNLNFTDVTGTSMRLNYTRGDGDYVIIIAKEGSPVDVTPQDLTNYNGGYSPWNYNYNQIGSTGNYVVYKGTRAYANLNGFSPGSTYYFAAYEFNGNSGPVYLTPGITGNQITTSYPSVAPTNLRFSSIEGNRMYVNFDRGNGQKHIIVASESEITGEPQDNVSYTANSSFGDGDTLSANEFIVYNGTSTGSYVNNLQPNTTYYFKVFGYNESDTNSYYLRAPALSGSQSTTSAPTLQSSNGLTYQRGDTSVGINWTRGNGDQVLVVAREGEAVNTDPENLTQYYANRFFGNGIQIGTDNYVVYRGTSNNVVVENLNSDTTYHFRVYEYNGYHYPVYLTPAYQFQASTYGSRPTVQVSNANFTNVSANSATVNFNAGDGPFRLVFARKDSPVAIQATDGLEYLANNQFGLGTDIGGSTYTVFNGSSETFSLENLDFNSTYHLAFYEYNIDASGQLYLSPAYTSSFTTAAPPSVNASDLVVSDIADNSLTLSWTNGNGNGRMVVLKEQATGSIGTPTQGMAYSANQNLAESPLLGDGKIVYFGTGNNITISGYALETEYEVQIFEFNGNTSNPVYAIPGYTSNFTSSEDLCPDDPDKTEPGDCGCGVPDTDSDGDGVADCIDLCPEDPDKTEPGDCGCGVPDTDTDGDGTPDCLDECPTNPDKTEPGVCGCDAPDVDSDGDGVMDCDDLCPNDPNKTEPGECGCGVEDIDTDGDGIFDCNDNCPDVYNPGQEDMDGDGIGDVCDDDIDGDGVPNDEDCQPENPDSSDPRTWYIDNDGDGYGSSDTTLVACQQPAGYVDNADDCDDNDADLNPGNQYFTFSNQAGFENSIINPMQGSPIDNYEVSVMYYDTRGNLPPYGYPRVIFDYEGNGVYNNTNDRSLILQEADPNDTDTSDGKLYYASISPLAVGQNYQILAQIVNGECETIFGPFDAPNVLNEPDLEIFANDISFDNSNPGVSSPLQITAVVHNASDLPAENFDVKLINQFDTNIVYEMKTVNYIAPNSSATLVWDIITPNVPAWCPMQVIVDYNNVIAESNELDNSAIRPFTNGDYNIPGRIDIINIATSPNPVRPDSHITLRGKANYGDTAVELEDPSVAGATVTFTVIETGETYSGYTNSAGNFNLRFPRGMANPNWEIGRTYHIEGSVTDFTLTGTFETTFEVIPCTNTDLSLVITADQSTHIGPGDSNFTAIVRNNGCVDMTEATDLVITQNGGSPSIAQTYSIPALAAEEEHTVALGTVSYLDDPYDILTYSITGAVDTQNQIIEQSEYNNSFTARVKVYPTKPDLTPVNQSYTNNIKICTVGDGDMNLRISNIGYVASGEFNANVKVYHNNVLQNEYTNRIASISPNGTGSISIPRQYNDIGDYRFEISVDTDNEIIELNELNNAITIHKTVVECLPDLVMAQKVGNRIMPAIINPTGGDILTINALVKNGNIPYDHRALADINEPIDVNFTLSLNGDNTVYTENISGGLNAHESSSLTINAPLPTNHGDLVQGEPQFTHLRIEANPSQSIEEESYQNNLYEAYICHDFAVTLPCNVGNDAFYGNNLYQYKNVVPWIKVHNYGILGGSDVTVKFEVKLPVEQGEPDLDQWIQLGTVTLDEVLAEKSGCYDGYNVMLPTSFVFNENGAYTFRFTVDDSNDYLECNEANNVLYHTLFVEPKPDMRVLSQFINPSLLNPEVNEPISFNMTYENIGYQNVNDNMWMKVRINNTDWTSLQVNGLLNGENNTVLIPETYSFDTPGAHVVRLFIDSENEISELNEMNNEATRAIIVGQASNLYFETFITNNATPENGDQVTFTADIANNGDVDVNATVEFYYLDAYGQPILIDEQSISVTNNSNTVITQDWMVTRPITEIIALITNPDELEFNELDNEARLKLGTFNINFAHTPYCAGSQDGSLSAVPEGGTAPFQYQWNNGETSQTIFGANGSFMVSITDVNGLTATAAAEIQIDPDCSPVGTDTDGDGIPDSEDNCPYTANPDQADMDGDGIGDACDPDIDGDGILNDDDCDPMDPEVGTGMTYYEDADGDGYGNPEKSMVACEQPVGYVLDNTDCDDTNADIHPGAVDIPDNGIDENCDGVDATTQPEVDTDGDGIIDAEDNCPTVYNPDQTDSNGDGIGDACEACDEPYMVEITRTSPTTAMIDAGNTVWHYQGSANLAGRPLRPYPMYGMTDMTVPHTQQGLMPAFEYDVWLRTICEDGSYSDWTGPFFVPTYEEEIPYDCPELEANFGDACDDENPNTENDIITESCDCVGTPIEIIDTDEDGVPDDEDNCPTVYNPDQADGNGDGIGDACEACDEPYMVELVRTSPTTASFNAGNSVWHYQGSANRAGRPLRPYPMYGMEDLTVPHTQQGLVPTIDYDAWFRTICLDGSYSDWVGPFNLPQFSSIGKLPRLTIIPNPTVGPVEFMTYKIKEIYVYDAFGKLVLVQDVFDNKANLKPLQTGRYTINAIDENGKLHQVDVIKR